MAHHIEYPLELDSRSVWLGFKQLLPISAFVAIFGAAFGLAATQTGLSGTDIVLMSALAFAGAAQFAVLDIWGTHVPLIPLVAAVFAINARHLLMGATLYPWLRRMPPGQRYGAMLVVSDANWAMSIQALARGEPGIGMMLGGGIVLWLTWTLGSWLGVYFGNAIEDPVRLGLDMVMGCFLLTMVVGGKKRPEPADEAHATSPQHGLLQRLLASHTARKLVIGIVAAAAALLAYRYLPENTHVVVGALAGGLLGAIWMEKTA